ncbi:MAG: hypothetical protein RL235_895 [Chlamydiota bacterium]|jgi:glycerol-3-phosphate dehydrogenase
MNRHDMLQACLYSPDLWDVIIIGGGATGLGCAVDAASRGYRTLLVERGDFGMGTSSRSTKLIHGGLRYLQQGHIFLVHEALTERGLLIQNAPHLVHRLPFCIPTYKTWEKPFYSIGIALYDILASGRKLGASERWSTQETIQRIPTLQSDRLKGSVVYYDGQFDDARLAITLAQTAADLGAYVINQMEVIGLVEEHGKIGGVRLRDRESGQELTQRGKVVINACGVFSDGICALEEPGIKHIRPSQGVHLVLDRSFFPSSTAVVIPHTDDGRVLFLIPWHRHVIVGTTDTPVPKIDADPKPTEEEVSFLLSHAGRYLQKAPTQSDILSCYAGLRPLIKANRSTADASRRFALFTSPKGLVTITGGKWTTYRKMAESAVDQAIKVGKLPKQPCTTKGLKLHGYLASGHASSLDIASCYGTDQYAIDKLTEQAPDLGHLLHPKLPYCPAHVVWAVRHEMAYHLDDVLARRLRALLLNVRATLEIAPRVAKIMAKELGKDEAWEKDELKRFQVISQRHLYTARD